MKKLFVIGIMISLFLGLVLSCYGEGSSDGNGGGTNYTPGQLSTFSVGRVAFNMHYAPRSSFKSDDNAINGKKDIFSTKVTVDHDFWVAETEVTYEQWYAVRTWAVNNSGYIFTNNAGREGSMGMDGAVPTSGNKLHPVTRINWRDSIVWCNALTEYYNVEKGTNLECAYKDRGGKVIRDSTSTTICDSLADYDHNAKGFRLPTSDEWELAARYQNGTNWIAGDHVSGDLTGYCYNSGISATESTIFAEYAWYSDNSNNGEPSYSTQPVGGKKANFLNLRDMSGNVNEWCFDWYPEYIGSYRIFRGGCWSFGAFFLQLGAVANDFPYHANNLLGFRPVRTQ